jgi:ribosomal-protein-alanine N-acetyltransferase
MNGMSIQTNRLRLVPKTREDVLAWINQMQPNEKAELSADWLALVEGSGPIDPWIHGFLVLHRDANGVIGHCGFKGPPETDGSVEIAYGVASEHQGHGYATEAAEALASFAFSHDQVRVVRAHTRPELNASSRVLTKCGFRKVGETVDPDDGLVWRWEKDRGAFWDAESKEQGLMSLSIEYWVFWIASAGSGVWWY